MNHFTVKRMNKLQLRCEFRTDGPGRSIIGKIPYNSIADMGNFRETLISGCFSESLASGRKVVALLGHDQGRPLGNTHSGTLVLDDQADGLSVTIIPDQEITWGKDALLAAGRGDFGGLSFGFIVPKGGEVRKGNLREIWRAELLEISPCTWPAYEETTISTRNQQSMETEMNNQTTIHPRQNQEYINERGEKLFTREDIRRMDEEFERRGGYVQPPNLGFDHADVQDQPIYRGPTALGQQMVDIIHLIRSGAVAPEARDRHDQMVKRERSLAERRAAGTGGMVEAVGQDGGLLLQGETSMEMLTSGFNNSAVLSRAARRDIGVNQFADLVGVDETSRADGSRGGGVRVYTDKELEQILQSKPKLAKIRLEPKRLTGMYFASNEILQNAPLLQQEMADLFNEEFSFKGQDLAINGSGAGEALGVLKAPCLVTVAKEANQIAYSGRKRPSFRRENGRSSDWNAAAIPVKTASTN